MPYSCLTINTVGFGNIVNRRLAKFGFGNIVNRRHAKFHEQYFYRTYFTIDPDFFMFLRHIGKETRGRII